MSVCHRCGATLSPTDLRCVACGVTVHNSASMTVPLTSLTPEAEPPLPAGSEVQRARGAADDGPATPVTQISQKAKNGELTLSALASEPAPLPMSVPPPMNLPVDVGPAWFGEPPAQPPQTPVPAIEIPISTVGTVPTLTGSSSFARRAIVIVIVCLVVGAAVGWLVSTPAPPTPDEIRARGSQKTTP